MKTNFEKENSKEPIFTTQDFWLSGFLLASGFRLVNIQKIDQKRVAFCFEDKAEREKLVQDYFNGVAVINVRDLKASVNNLKTLIYENKNERSNNETGNY